MQCLNNTAKVNEMTLTNYLAVIQWRVMLSWANSMKHFSGRRIGMSIIHITYILLINSLPFFIMILNTNGHFLEIYTNLNMKPFDANGPTKNIIFQQWIKTVKFHCYLTMSIIFRIHTISCIKNNIYICWWYVFNVPHWL